MMKYCLYILLFLIGFATSVQAQRAGRERGGRGTFSLSNKEALSKMPDSLLLTDSAALRAKRITAYQLTPLLGEPHIAPMDTNRLNYGGSTLVESKSLAVGYLANLGSPAETRIFSEREEARDFIFADAYNYYITDPKNARFYDTRIPYTHVMYTTAGGSDNKEEQLKGTLALNFGKKINVGGDLDYIYGRGHYNSNGNKLLSYRLFGSYRSDRYELNAYMSNYNFVNYENGGIRNDLYITKPDAFEETAQAYVSKDIPVRYDNTWNRVRGKQYFLTHRYNLGFSRTLEETDAEGNEKNVFVPVSSIIHTLVYEDNRRHFLSKNAGIDTCYTHAYGNSIPTNKERTMEDETSSWSLKNTFALSLREGFQDWAKMGLTAFVNFEKRSFQLPAPTPGYDYAPYGQNAEGPLTIRPGEVQRYDEFSTYIGAELSKRQGSLLTYDARGELCIVGDDIGEFRATGNLQTKFPLFKKDATIRAVGYIKNVTPAFYLRHNHTRYFWWDMKLKNIQQIYAGAEVNLQSTRTKLSAGVESLQNFVYIGKEGVPQQAGSNLQVVSVRLKQDIHYRAFGWDNEIAYQLSSDKSVLPLPQLSVYTNMYVAFKVAKVLTMQLGANMYYNTSYYAPYYEPASQQFQRQDEVKVGGYPLINAYVNFHLKQARFFVMAYNLSSKFADPNYFSLAHYPLNPMVLKMGIAVTFNN